MSGNGKFKDKFPICVECGEEFIFDADSQAYFESKGWDKDPKRCKHCYHIHKRDKKMNIDNLPPDNRPGV